MSAWNCLWRNHQGIGQRCAWFRQRCNKRNTDKSCNQAVLKGGCTIFVFEHSHQDIHAEILSSVQMSLISNERLCLSKTLLSVPLMWMPLSDTHQTRSTTRWRSSLSPAMYLCVVCNDECPANDWISRSDPPTVDILRAAWRLEIFASHPRSTRSSGRSRRWSSSGDANFWSKI